MCVVTILVAKIKRYLYSDNSYVFVWIKGNWKVSNFSLYLSTQCLQNASSLTTIVAYQIKSVWIDVANDNFSLRKIYTSLMVYSKAVSL